MDKDQHKWNDERCRKLIRVKPKWNKSEEQKAVINIGTWNVQSLKEKEGKPIQEVDKIKYESNRVNRGKN